MTLFYNYESWMIELRRYLRINSLAGLAFCEAMTAAECLELFESGQRPEVIGREIVSAASPALNQGVDSAADIA